MRLYMFICIHGGCVRWILAHVIDEERKLSEKYEIYIENYRAN